MRKVKALFQAVNRETPSFSAMAAQSEVFRERCGKFAGQF
jgi:hypothetical protein